MAGEYNQVRLEQLSLSEALSIEQVFQLQTRRCNTDTEHTKSNGQMYLQQFRSIIPSPAKCIDLIISDFI